MVAMESPPDVIFIDFPLEILILHVVNMFSQGNINIAFSKLCFSQLNIGAAFRKSYLSLGHIGIHIP